MHVHRARRGGEKTAIGAAAGEWGYQAGDGTRATKQRGRPGEPPRKGQSEVGEGVEVAAVVTAASKCWIPLAGTLQEAANAVALPPALKAHDSRYVEDATFFAKIEQRRRLLARCQVKGVNHGLDATAGIGARHVPSLGGTKGGASGRFAGHPEPLP